MNKKSRDWLHKNKHNQAIYHIALVIDDILLEAFMVFSDCTINKKMIINNTRLVSSIDG